MNPYVVLFLSLTRPLNDDEQRMNVQSVISCNEQKKEVSISQNIMMQADKSYTFDKVLQPLFLIFIFYCHYCIAYHITCYLYFTVGIWPKSTAKVDI